MTDRHLTSMLKSKVLQIVVWSAVFALTYLPHTAIGEYVGAPGEKKNLLFIMSDDLRPELSVYGRKHVHGHSNIWQWQRVTALSYWMRFVHASRRCEQAKNAMYVTYVRKHGRKGMEDCRTLVWHVDADVDADVYVAGSCSTSSHRGYKHII